ncbi:MAG: hypothetical protein KJ955_03105 [Nanoarchaeota archaeon]|nr:hypothetical protein [Nanoarchaeota archaeon]
MALEHVLGRYEHFLDDEDATIYTGQQGVETYKTPVDFVLSPEQINEFLQKAMDFDFGQSRYSEITGMYVTKLMQNCIDSKEHAPLFYLHVPIELESLGIALKAGRKEIGAAIHITGSLGNHCFTGSEGCSVDVHGNVQHHFARCAKNGVYRAYGGVGYAAAGYSENCTYEFYGCIKSGFDSAKDNTVRAHSGLALKVLKKCVPAGNLLEFVKDGKAERIVRMRDKSRIVQWLMRFR